MLEKLRDAFLRFKFLQVEDLLKLYSICKIKTIRKGEFFVKEGEMCYQVALVLKGLLRHYHLDENGNEKTVLFISEKRISISAFTIFKEQPCSENIVALEDTLVLLVDLRTYKETSKNNLNLICLENELLKEVIISDIEQIKSLTLFTPEQRYLQFCENYPNLEQRIKQKYLASFLGITPTSLSRLRARLII